MGNGVIWRPLCQNRRGKLCALTCSLLAGVLCPAAAGNFSGWFCGEVCSSAALDFSASLFSCGCLDSEPDSVVMANHTGGGTQRIRASQLMDHRVKNSLKPLIIKGNADEML